MAFREIEVYLLALLKRVNILIITSRPKTFEISWSMFDVLEIIIMIITMKFKKCIFDLFK